IGLAVAMIVKHWSAIKHAFKAAIDWIVGKVKGFGETVSSVFGDIGAAMWGGIKWGVNKIIDGLNWFIGAWNSVFGHKRHVGFGPLKVTLPAMHIDKVQHIGGLD